MKNLFRYCMVSQSERYEDCRLELQEYEVLEETEKSYLIKLHWPTMFRGWKVFETKRCRKWAWNKWFAHDTPEKALRHFIHRMKVRSSFLRADLAIATNWIASAEKILSNSKNND